MRVEPHDYHSIAAQEPGLVKAVGALAGNRMSGPGGLSGIAAEPPPPRAIVVGDRWDAPCSDLRRFLDRNQITFTWLQPDADDALEQWGGPLPPEADRPGDPRRRGQDRRAAAAAACGGAARPRHRAGCRGVRHGDRRRRPGRAGGGRSQRLGAPADDRDRARGARRPGRHLVADRELPRLSRRRLGRGAGQPSLAAGPPARCGDPRHPRDRADRHRQAARCSSTAGDVLQAHTIVLACGVSWRQLSDGRIRSPGREGRLVRRRRGARRRTRTGSTCTSSARATPPGRRRCSSRRTRAA